MSLVTRSPEDLSDAQLAFIKKARKLKGDVIDRTTLTELNAKLNDPPLLWSPAYITKNNTFKTKIRGQYNLAVVDGKAKAAKAFKQYCLKHPEKLAPRAEKIAPRKPATRAVSHGKRSARKAA
jgi:hypothetical protein